MTEYKLPVDMPALLGAGGEFIPNPEAGTFVNGLFQLEGNAPDSLHIGTIVGGIASTGRNIFWINDDAESAASSTLFDVYLVKSTVPQTQNAMSNDPLNLHVSLDHTLPPTRNYPAYMLHFTLGAPAEVLVEWSNKKGKVKHRGGMRAEAGEQIYPVLLPKKPGMYKISVTVNGKAYGLFFKVPEAD
jgi:hypothetical protein